MKKYIFALICMLVGLTQIQAQNTDLRSAPDVPTFQVTLNYGTVRYGTVTAKVNNQEVTSGSKIAYGATVDFTVVTNSGYKLSKVANGSYEVTSFSDVTFADGLTTYRFTSKALEGEANFQFTTESKTYIGSVSISNLGQRLPDIKEVTVKANVDDVPSESFKVQYDYDGDGSYEDFDASKFTAGVYNVLITRDEDANYKAYNLIRQLTVAVPQFRVIYRVDSMNGGRWSMTAKVGEDNFVAGFSLDEGSIVDFTLVTESGHRLQKILLNGTDEITDFEGSYSDGKSTYSYTTTEIRQEMSYQFIVIAKTDLSQLENLTIAHLQQTEGALQPVTVEGAPEGVTFKVEYLLNDEWTETFDPTWKAGTYKVRVSRSEDLIYKAYSKETDLVIKAPEKIGIVLKIDDLKATAVEVGKPLSSSILSGGYAQTQDEQPIAGTFEWKDPTQMIDQAGEVGYPVIFRPIDMRYAQAEILVKVRAIQYYTVTTGTSANGKVTIQQANAANKYEAGAKLTLIYTPDVYYRVVENQSTLYTVEGDAVITGRFEAIRHKVKIGETENGSLIVKNGDAVVTDGVEVAAGTQLKLAATPASGYKLASLTNGMNPIRNNFLIVDADLNIQAAFEPLPTEEFVVSLADMAHGKLLLLDEKGNSVSNGASVKKGTKLTAIAVADKGYELDGDILVGNEPVEVPYEVSAPTEFKASFKKISYSITKTTSEDVTIRVLKDNNAVSAVERGDVLTISAEVTNENKRLHSLVVNGKEIANGSTYTVENAVNIVANLVDKATIQLLDLTQVVTYDGRGKQFIVRSVPAGLSGFKVTYEGVAEGSLPVDAANNTERSYQVTITRDTDLLYKAVSETGTLTIKAASSMYGKPTWDDQIQKWIGEIGEYIDKGADNDTGFRDVIFKPENRNHQQVIYNLAIITAGLLEVDLSNTNLRATSSVQNRVTITSKHGGVTLWNGAEKLTNSSIAYVGQTLTVRGLPDPDYSTKADWTINGTKTTGAESTTITLQEGVNTIEVSFKPKDKPVLPTLNKSNVNYTGSPILPTVIAPDGITGWNILVKSGDLIVDEPTDVGNYDVYVTRSEDETYASVNEKIGTFTISKQQMSDLTVLSASPILKGQTLAQSELTGSAPVAGTFAWKNPTLIPTDATTQYDVIFIPEDTKNYEVANTVSLKQSVTFLSGSTTATARVITFSPAENGTFVVKVNGVVVETGAQVSTGDQVVVETTPNSGYSASVSYIGITNGKVGESGNVSVTVTFTKNSTPGGGESEPDPQPQPQPDPDPQPNPDPLPDPDPEVPTVSNPVVAERTATTAVITWEKVAGAMSYKLFLYANKTDSTPLKTYEFDKDGKLKSTAISFMLTDLEEGKAYYVETVAYNVYGTLLVKKSVELAAMPTGIEAISKGSQLYTVKGAIVVIPVEPLQVVIYSVTGQLLYHEEVSGRVEVPEKAGIYVVVIRKDKVQITEKVLVN